MIPTIKRVELCDDLAAWEVYVGDLKIWNFPFYALDSEEEGSDEAHHYAKLLAARVEEAIVRAFWQGICAERADAFIRDDIHDKQLIAQTRSWARREKLSGSLADLSAELLRTWAQDV
jgi:hypothetical protein